MLPPARGVAMKRTKQEAESHRSVSEKAATCRFFQPFSIL
jgi:hypothetical protein